MGGAGARAEELALEDDFREGLKYWGAAVGKKEGTVVKGVDADAVDGKALLFDLVLMSMAVPTVILMVPLFRLTVLLRLYDTMGALILPFAVTGFGILYMRYAISAVPDSLIDSARVAGLSETGALFRVVLPAIWPSVAPLAVLQFIASWSAFVLPHAVIASPRNYTIGLLLGRLMADYGGLMWNDIMVIVIAALVPVLLAFLVFNRWVLQGATAIGDDRSAIET